MNNTLDTNVSPIPFPASKRTFDIVISFLLLVLLSPFILISVVLLLLEYIFIPKSRGPLFYKEIRYSAGAPFNFYKFRIFKQSAIETARNGNGVVHTKDLEHTKGATTYMGHLLKQVYMDELPQLFNVLKGDMSLVGPRPTNTDNMKNLLREKKFAKFLIKAGITGYFQSHKGEKLKENQEETDMRYISYVKNNPGWKIILYDTKILLITIKTIFRAEGI